MEKNLICRLQALIRGRLGRCLIVVISISSITLTAKADEGFFETKPAVAGLAQAWDATFLVVLNTNSSYYLGSAALIASHQNQSTQDLYFLTAFHVIKDNCKINLPCKGATLLQNVKAPFNLAGLQTLISQPVLKFNRAELVKSDKRHDLALLRIRTTIKSRVLPISLTKNCEDLRGSKAYAFGFPAVSDRTSAGAKKIANPLSLTKRWSQGIVADPLFVEKNGNYLPREASAEISPFVALTDDVLEGNSGGAVVNDNGELISLMKATTAEASSGYQYDTQWNAIGVRCEILSNFLAD